MNRVYLRKGSKVFVEGQLKTRKWADTAGVERYVTEIHLTPFNGTLTFLDSKRDAEDRSSAREAAPPRDPAPARAGGGRADADLDDEISF